MPIVQMPDGALVDMPDAPTPEQLAGLRAKASAPKPAAESPIMRGLKVGGSALMRGLASIPAMMAELSPPDPRVQAGLSIAGQPPVVDQPGGTYMNMASGIGTQPQTQKEKYAAAALEGVGGAMALPIGGPVRAAIQGGMSGLGSEASAKAFGDTTFNRVLGGLGAGGATGVLQSILPQRGNVARELMRDVKPQDFQQAVAGMERNIKAGTPTNLSQTMPKASNIDSGIEALANSPHGPRVTDMLRNQPAQAELNAVAEMSGLPGMIQTERNIADAGQQAMTDRLVMAKKARTDAVTPLYNQAGELPPQAVKNLRDILAEKAMEPGTSIDTIKTIQALGRELSESSATGLPRTHAMDVKAAIDDTIRSGLQNTLNPTSPKTQGELKYLTKKLYEALGESSPQIKEANALFRRITEQEVDPLKKSIVGNIAGRGARDDVSAAQSKVFAIFNKGTPEGATQSDILDFEKATRLAGQPEVYQDAFKSWLNEKLSKAFKSDTARGQENVSKNLVAELGNPMQSSKEWNTLQDALAGLARSEGKPANTYVNGMKSLLRLNAEMAIRPTSIKGASSEALKSMSKDSMLTRAGSTSFIAPLRQPALAMARLTGARVLGEMDTWLTTPEGAAKLAELGKHQYLSPGWVKTLQTMSATAAASEGDE